MAHDEPIAVAVEHTLAFLAPHLPPAGARLLEVGCGDGTLAARLGESGLRVTALDRDPESIEHAWRRGVAAVVGDFLTYEDAPFDALLFARVLHHLDPLPDAIERAYALLAPGGLVLVEDFAVERMTEDGARWFYDTLARLEATSLIAAEDPHGPGDHDDPLERWRAHHRHHAPIHESVAMETALANRFEIVHRSQAPYLYRYFCGRLEASPRGAQTARLTMAAETLRIDDGSLPAIGLRIVGRRPR